MAKGRSATQLIAQRLCWKTIKKYLDSLNGDTVLSTAELAEHFSTPISTLKHYTRPSIKEGNSCYYINTRYWGSKRGIRVLLDAGGHLEH